MAAVAASAGLAAAAFATTYNKSVRLISFPPSSVDRKLVDCALRLTPL